MKRKQSGFTLVEIAIVLVIIGLLIGGVLKGQALIDSAKVKAEGTKVNKIVGALSIYYDRYNKLPGDAQAASPNGVIDSTEMTNAMKALSDLGVLTSADMVSPLTGGEYLFVGSVINTTSGWYSFGTAFTSIYPVKSNGVSTSTTQDTANAGSPRSWCLMEVNFDDRNTLAGNMRQVNSVAPVANATLATANVDTCNGLSGVTSGNEMIKVW